MRVAVIGGGITGLSAAYYLAKAGVDVTVIDKSPSRGGLLQTSYLEGCVLEHGPDSFLSSKPWALDLAKELGIESEIIGSNDNERVIYVIRNGRPVRLPNGLMMMAPTRFLPLLASPLLGWGTKLGMGLEYFRRASGVRPADRSVEDFLLDHYSREALDYLAEPLLAGVYGGDPAALSAASVLPRFVEFESRYGSLTRGAIVSRTRDSSRFLFVTLKNGLGSLITALEAALKPAVSFLRGTVEAVEKTSDEFHVQASGSTHNFDAVILACPAPQAAPLVASRHAELAELLAAIPYHSAITVALGYDRAECSVSGFGFLVPRRERRKLLACTFVHNKFRHRAPEDKAVLRCFFGGESMSLTDAQIIAAAREELATFLNLQAEPVFSNIVRLPQSMPQYTVGHAERVRRMEAICAGIPGLSLAGNAYHGLGIPDCVRSGKEAAERIISWRTPSVRRAPR